MFKNIRKVGKHQGKNPDTEDYILHDSIYIKFKNRKNYKYVWKRNMVARAGGW